MRLVLATLFALYVAIVVALPHGHGPGTHEAHDCIACTTAGAEPLTASASELAPPLAFVEAEAVAPRDLLPSGAPLGAVPGQSPPAA